MKQLRALFQDNPMLDEPSGFRRKLLSSGTASRTLAVFIVGMVGIMVTWLLCQAWRYHFGGATIVMTELFLLTLIAPFSVYNAIAGERERATWEALILTRLTPGQIIAGKLVWRLVFMAAMMALGSLFLAVDASSKDGNLFTLVEAQGVVFSWCVFLYTFGLWVSACCRRSVMAAASIIGTMLCSLVLIPVLLSVMDLGMQRDYVAWFYSANPFVLLGGLPISNLGQVYRDGISFSAVMVAWIGLYAAGSVVCLTMTHRQLRRLEAPTRDARRLTRGKKSIDAVLE